MSGVKRNAEHMSSSDDDCVFLYEVNTEAAAPPHASTDASPCAPPPVELESSLANQANMTTSSSSDPSEVLKKRKLDMGHFLQFLDQHIPIKLIPAKSSAYIVEQANLRLQQAHNQGIDIKDVTIGADCLPTWDELYWDSEEESLHEHLQTRLMDFEMSQDIGFLRSQVINTWKKKWEQACALGLVIDQVRIGSDLLPLWKTPAAEEEEEEEEEENMQMNTSTEDTEHITEDHVASEPATPENETFFSLSTNSSSKPTTATGPSSVSSPSSTTSTNEGSDDDDDDEEFDDVVPLDFFVDPASCEYEEPDEEELNNIFHEAEIVDAPPGYQSVDLEVYLVDGDDPDLDDMPEIELGIDRLAFEMYHDTDEAVDIEIPGMHVRTTTNLPLTTQQYLHILEQQVRDDEEQERLRRHQHDLQRAREARLAIRNRLPADETTTPPGEQEKVYYPYESDSDASEEVTSDEEEAPAAAVEVRDTEDGFVW